MEIELEKKLLERFDKFLNLQWQADHNGEYFRCQKGWWMILYLFFQRLEEKGFDVKFTCIKEKYGWLRLYPDHDYAKDKRHSPKDMLHPELLAILQAHRRVCGDPGTDEMEMDELFAVCEGAWWFPEEPRALKAIKARVE